MGCYRLPTSEDTEVLIPLCHAANRIAPAFVADHHSATLAGCDDWAGLPGLAADRRARASTLHTRISSLVKRIVTLFAGTATPPGILLLI